MARNLLTAKAVLAAKPTSREYMMGDGEGLYLRVRPNGKKAWFLIYSNGENKRSKISLGELEDVTLADARILANRERMSLAAGEDPRSRRILEKDEQKKRAAEIDAREEFKKEQDLTLQDLFNVWIRDGVTRGDGNKALTSSFQNHILPKLGKKILRELTETDIRDLLRQVGRAAGKNRTAVVLATDLRQMMRWAEKRKPWRALLIEGNPAELVEPKEVVQLDYDLENECDRVLSTQELQALHSKIKALQCNYDNAVNKRRTVRPLKPTTKLALWIMLSTCCRVGELTMARWEHIDFGKKEWLVPRRNAKTKKDWVVFLSDFALRQFKALYAITGQSAWCFPASQGDTHMCVKTISKQVGDRQVQFKKRTQLKGRRNDNSLVLPGGEWSPHDMRRTGSTIMQSLGVLDPIRDRCLNHVVGGKIGRVYGRYAFAAEKRKAWAKLGRQLEKIFDGRS